MKLLQYSILPAMLLIIAMLSGCGMSYLEMSRTAGYAGPRQIKMYVLNIEGKDTDKFRDQLYKALADDGHFMVERYGIAPPQATDSSTNIPSITLSGIHGTHEGTSFFSEGSGKDEKKYKQRTESHEFQYTIRDAVTGEELDINVIRRENNGPKEEDQGFLSSVVGDALNGAVQDLVGVEMAHRKALIGEFVPTLRLHPEKRTIILFDDKDIPELKEGIEFVRKENWSAAIAKFQAGAESHPKSEVLHKAYFDLGLAFEYNHDFEKALTSLRLADELAPQAGYATEINYCKWFDRQYRWQQRYVDSSSGVTKSVDK